MKDSEDIINSMISFLTEDVGGGISRINQAIIDVNSEKGDNLLPPASNDIILGQRLQELNIFKNGRLNLDVAGESKFNPSYDMVAKNYIVEVSYIIRDDFSKNVFIRALRMERVITDIMQCYFKEAQEAGFVRGEVESAFTPERVLLGNTDFKAIKSGIVYNVTIF